VPKNGILSEILFNFLLPFLLLLYESSLPRLALFLLSHQVMLFGEEREEDAANLVSQLEDP